MNEQSELKEARLLAAASYVLFLCFLPPLVLRDNPFAMYHARQGFLLFLLEIFLAIFIYVVEHSLGLIPYLGLAIVVLLKLVIGLGLLFTAAAGVARAAAGRHWTIPVLGEYHHRVPF
ncbi:MAG: hypothetical protein V2A71_11010 [Candidatus Eisenbacteria bacterium]